MTLDCFGGVIEGRNAAARDLATKAQSVEPGIASAIRLIAFGLLMRALFDRQQAFACLTPSAVRHRMERAGLTLNGEQS